MNADAPLSELLPNLPAGDEVAARAIFVRYSDRLVGLARQHLSRKLAARIDAEDVVQSVFRTFFRREAAGEFQIDSTGQLWQLLVKITIMKARAKGRYHTAGMRNATTEARLEPEGYEPSAADPGPAEAAELVDQIDALLRGLPPLYGQLLGLRLQGRNVSETADELNVSRQTIHRAMNLLQDRLTAMAADA